VLELPCLTIDNQCSGNLPTTSMFLIFDTETTGLPGNWNAPLTDFNNWPRVVQLAWQLHDQSGKLISAKSVIIRPDGFTIPFNAEKVHGISTDRAMREGIALNDALILFLEDVNQSQYLAGHNIEFDMNIMGCELLRSSMPNYLEEKKSLDTKELATDFCAIPGGKGGKFKWPTLTELHEKLFGVKFQEAHDAAYDVDATSKCFFELLKKQVIRVPEAIASEIIYEAPVLSASNFKSQQEEIVSIEKDALELTPESITEVLPFAHLHVHTQYSVLQCTSDISGLIKKAKEWSSPAIAMTDHGNMMAAFQFVTAALKQEIKPIIGCEVNLCRDMHDKKNQDNGFQVVLLAKNKAGYHRLAKLSSLAHTEGYYYVPRIDRNLLLQFKEDLIVLSGGVFGEVAWKILNEGEEKAEEAFVWWKENFGEDFYAELNRHGLEEEDHVNKVMLQFCAKHGVKYVATNSSYYTNKTDSEAQDALICVREGEQVSRPKKIHR
jgi:DNA polymerase-3 subunit alpha